jgi:hypothetical protein
LDLSTFLIVLSGKNKKNGFYFSDKRSIFIYGKKKFDELFVWIQLESSLTPKKIFKAFFRNYIKITPFH